MGKQSRGFCKYCGKEYTRSGILRHLAACKERTDRQKKEESKTKCGYFELVIYGRYDKEYWLVIEINENAVLEELDQFLRDIWLECCGHLSAFTIHGVSYEVMPVEDSFWGEPAESMDYKLKDVLSVGDRFTYEYDFGSTTDLVLSVHSHRTGGKRKEDIVVLSRNNPPEIICSVCGTNKAQWVDAERIYDENPFWCEECRKKAEEEDGKQEFLLPVCNSPRMGICGYEGSVCYPEQFEPDKPGK